MPKLILYSYNNFKRRFFTEITEIVAKNKLIFLKEIKLEALYKLFKINQCR